MYSTDTTEPFDYQTAATYICNTGYGLSVGDRVGICVGSSQGPGEWRGTAPTCQGKHFEVYIATVNYLAL